MTSNSILMTLSIVCYAIFNISAMQHCKIQEARTVIQTIQIGRRFRCFTVGDAKSFFHVSHRFFNFTTFLK